MSLANSEDKHNPMVMTLTEWCSQSNDGESILLTLGYLEQQEGVERKYAETIQLSLEPGMCRELGNTLLRISGLN